MLNICIDIGNTNAKMGIFRNDHLAEIRNNVPDRKIVDILKSMNPDNILIASVRKGIGKIIEKAKKIAHTQVLNHLTPLPISINYKTPETLGVDRIAAAAGASFLHPNKNNLIVDIGTCITYDFIDAEGIYQGGGISPGVDMRLKAMHKFTSKLPVIASAGKVDLIGKSTKECMKSGAVLGTVAEIEGIISRYGQFFEDLNIIFCGGGANFFESKIKGHIFAVPNLVLVGLNQILRNNLHD